MNKILIRILFYLAAVVLLAACGRKGGSGDFGVKLYQPEYASGFEILGADGMQSSIVVTKTPWQGSDSTAVTRLFVARNGELPPDGFDGQVLQGDANRIVCMSSSYIAMLDAVGDADKVVGVSGIDFVCNPSIQKRRAEVGDVGFEGNIDYERLIALDPDLVLLYSVSSANRMEPKLRELGIPFMYVGEYLEEDPLGKAEWMVAVNEVTGNRAAAEKVFAEIPERYNNLRELAKPVESPSVMINTPYGDSWLMASTGSYVARLIRDAGGDYAYKANSSNQSMPIDMEEAYRLVSQADVWLNVGQYNTLAELTSAFPKFADTKPVKSGEVWNSSLRVSPAGGNDYWESGVVHPDLVLQDLIKIFHPELLKDREFTYYKRL